jgi:hypothetical protein
MAFVVLSLGSTVALLCTMGFFMMGSLPLMILKHDTPLDARFIRGLFALYYAAVMATASVAAASCALTSRPSFAAGMVAIAALAVLLRRVIVGRMDALRATMTADDAPGIASFRRLHVRGMLINVAQLGAVVWGLTRLAPA